MDETATHLTIIGRLRALTGREDELRDALLEVTRASREEPGCLNFDLHQDLQDPAKFIIYENWRDEAALALHFSLPHSLALALRLPTLLAEPLHMERLRELSVFQGRRS